MNPPTDPDRSDPRKRFSPGTNHDHRRTGGVPVQYAENRVTMQLTKEAFRATGMLPLPFIPEGRTDSPPEGRWSPLTGPCALRGSPSKPASGFRGYRPSMQALTGLSQPNGLTSWGISCLRMRQKGFSSSNIAGSFAFGNSPLGSRFCTMPFGNLRSLSSQRATGCAVISPYAIPPCALLSCHWQHICGMAQPATGSLRARRGRGTTKEVNADGHLSHAGEGREPWQRSLRRGSVSLYELLQRDKRV